MAETWRVRVVPKRGDFDVAGAEKLREVHALGMQHVSMVRSATIYELRGHLDEPVVRRLADDLLCDAVNQRAVVVRVANDVPTDVATVEVFFRPGVMDAVALTAMTSLRRLMASWGGESGAIDAVRTGIRYEIEGVADRAELETLTRGVLVNDCVQQATLSGFGETVVASRWVTAPLSADQDVRRVQIRGRDDAALDAVSRDGHLFLNTEEMRAIQRHYDALGRDPTDIELETLAQTWSEHCVHKTLKADVWYEGDDFGRDGHVELRFDNLLKTTIVHATRTLDCEWCLSVFDDNAGVIAFDDDHGIAFKVETHNRPSAIEPYGGAATGIGGCIRDIMGCGLGAKPVANTDVFCVADPRWSADRLPQGVLHPRRVLNGVVQGVRDYGNRMGIPTVNGAILFEKRYLTNPLVFCGCVGLLPRRFVHKEARAGDCIVVLGGRTGRDGIHGATFSSGGLTDRHAEDFAHAVQIGHPIEQKRVLEAVLRARNEASGCLFNAITDCGAGGLSSAIGEMGEKLGATVHLEKVPLKYEGLRYDEIWISEAQERMVLSVPPENVKRLIEIAAAEETEATVVGTFEATGLLRLMFGGTLVGELDLAFLHEGLPRRKLKATWTKPETIKSEIVPDAVDNKVFLHKLHELNIASKQWVIRQYDHEVQGGSSVKPLVGPGIGPSDAAVVRPLLTSDRGFAVACGLCPQESDRDPYTMAIYAVDEAIRNVVCVGGDLSRTAILDNFSWGDVSREESVGALVRACVGAKDAAIAYGTPFISGKDSLNNQFTLAAEDAERLDLPQHMQIPHTLLISAISVIADVTRCVTMDLKCVGSSLVYVRSDSVDDLDAMMDVHRAVAGWIADGRVLAAHDVSDGGVGVTLAEMCIASNLSINVDVGRVSTETNDGALLFGERPCAYVLEWADGNGPDDDRGLPLGKVVGDATMTINRDGREVVLLAVKDMRTVWSQALERAMGV